MNDLLTMLRSMAGALLGLFPIPDGEIRETILDLANPCRKALKEIVRKSDAADERQGLRKAFKAFDTSYLTDEQAADLIHRTLDNGDPDVVTVSHDHTVGALTKLRDDLRANGDTETEPVGYEDGVPYDQDTEDTFSNSGGDTLAMSDEETEAVRAYLADRRAVATTEGTKS